MIKIFLPFMFCVLTVHVIYAQRGIVPSGGTDTDNKVWISYTIGQVDYLRLEGENGTISAGIQQPLAINTVSRAEEYLDIDISIFPNPTSESITIQSEELFKEKLNYILVSGDGKLVKRGRLTQNGQQINMSRFGGGLYFLALYTNKQFVQTFRIIRTKN